MSKISISPIFILPFFISQNLTISFAIVDFPEPEAPTRAVTVFSFALKEISFSTSLYNLKISFIYSLNLSFSYLFKKLL
jgi:hypothetical protein